ncbi:kinase-like domain-containing protein [Aspergillus flavus]|uniref:Aminoglycoside phosphotransferase n=4 Tax=Aspergillus subgen. Circumdati TaxID=2720871 RepID=A0A1S9DAE1_ASPOZ|nr:hypothetical protein Ao3042_02854 [Aspergillus oryzae 3.042]KAB8250209.1 kinase-like domain-containing protein [Aspergillus flavus]KDE80754.1 hypothetical protein AO1008_07299 [Aspergillus oryzae 100-8]OOO05979.1 aminoglycoside phosphotransferase [Aspergillus oryzae]GMG52299.1 unnamed protein product [Aspergillus oryzae var. brunneus]|eukprot:EIT80756.1 hypothetical protein Ao3042_02854 [Aspergillus oryzae 3.042]
MLGSSLSTTKLPFFRDLNQLPCPLPTTEDIEAGTILPTKSERISGDHGHVAVVGDHFVVKYGQFILENEGHALLLLEKYPSIPVPRLYAMYRKDDILYLVMQLLPGADLSKLWGELSCNEKASICDQLKEAFAQIRTIPSPGYFGSVTGGPVQHRFFGWVESDPRIMGPFETLEDFHLDMALVSQRQEKRNDRHPWGAEWFARHLPQALKDHLSTFTHCDLVKQNIMVQELPQTDRHTDRKFKVTGIIDWELPGWYPRYWEYAAFFADFLWEGERGKMFETFIDPWPLEAALLGLFKHDLEGY